MLKCITCDKTLTGLQRKFCSNKCKCKTSNVKFQNYQAQRKRGMKRKAKLIKDLGGKCKVCGYKKNISALCFHHKIASEKKIKLDLRSLSNHSLTTIQIEVEKCELLCANCHAELHHPELINT
jgi:hypothetical protein